MRNRTRIEVAYIDVTVIHLAVDHESDNILGNFFVEVFDSLLRWFCGLHFSSVHLQRFADLKRKRSDLL